MANTYKLAKEAFVSNLNGGSISEINRITFAAPASVLLWSALQSQQSLFTPYSPLAALIDFLLNCGVILFATTLYSSQPYLLNYLLILPALAVVISSNLTAASRKKSKVSAREASPSKKHDERDPLPLKPFVTTYRGTMMVVTCVAILAVDFKVFPRRFAKVENWGTSLMDLGVGSFVFSAGTVSARAILKQRLSPRSKSLRSRLQVAMRHALPLFILGLVRLYSVKGLDYAEHVTEYGIHWNFFFTLAFLPPFVALFDFAFGILPSYGAIALILAVVYETLLDFTDLKRFVLSAPRINFLSKNREGIFSFLGYLAIFVMGQSTGMYVLPREAREKSRLRSPLLQKLATWSALWCALFYVSTSYQYGLNLQVSRRLANLPYILWVAAFNTSQIALFCLIENLFFPYIYSAQDRTTERELCNEASSRLLRAFNRNGLAVFLLANLMTGAVNIVLPTLRMSDPQAMGVLVVYMAVLSGVALALDWRDISIKL